MQQRFKLHPMAAAIACLRSKPQTASAAEQPKTVIRKLLPLGAMLAGMTFASQGTWAQTAPASGETTLPTVNVQVSRDPENKGYQGGATSVGKTPQLPRDIPQAITIIPQQLIYDRNADTMREALRNVPSLTFNAGEGGRIGDNITLRGFSVVGDLYLDGIRDIAQYNRETFNLEQIDVLRGSASMLFGRGSTGGIINQVSKTPFLADRYETALTVGTDDYYRATADLNKKVGDGAAIRFNVMKTDAKSFREGVQTDRLGYAPSIRWGIGTRNEFAVSHYHLGYNDVPDYGVPYFQGLPLAVPVERFYGIANADYQKDDTDITTFSYTHRFSTDTEIKSVLRKARYRRDLWAVAPRLPGGTTFITGATAINRQAQRRAGEEDTITSQTDFNTRFAAAGMKHNLLVGMELLREEASRWNWAGGGANPATTVGNTNPYVIPLPANFFSASRAGQVDYRANTAALYTQDTIEFLPMWKAVVGARYDNFKADYERPAPQGELSRTDRVWSWRTGLIFQPSDAQSYYVAYGTSFNPSGELYALDDRGANTPPEKNRNIEAGAKWELFEGNLSLRTAVFRSEKTNERNTDLAVTVEQNLLSGRRHTDGIEVEAAGRITKDWEVFAGASLLDAKIDAATGQQANTLGKAPLNTPDYTSSLWTVYRLGGGWKVGGGVEAVGLRWGNNTNTNAVPHYTRYDALLAYEQKSYDLKLNVLNLTDTDYYEGVYQGHVIPGTKRAIQITLKLKF